MASDNTSFPVMSYVWAMPNKNTFSIPPIRQFVRNWQTGTSLDPFCGDQGWGEDRLASYTNDMNPNKRADFNMRALDFLKLMEERGVFPNLVIFDPPYSLRQAKEVYESYGEWKFSDTQQVGTWQEEKKVLARIMPLSSVFLHFGWHSNGMGKKYGFEKREILLVGHGRSHNDTICLAEVRVSYEKI